MAYCLNRRLPNAIIIITLVRVTTTARHLLHFVTFYSFIYCARCSSIILLHVPLVATAAAASSVYKFSNVIRAAKENKIGYNKVGIHFSPIIFHVVAVVPPPAINATRQTGYQIADAAGNIIMAGVAPKICS